MRHAAWILLSAGLLAPLSPVPAAARAVDQAQAKPPAKATATTPASTKPAGSQTTAGQQTSSQQQTTTPQQTTQTGTAQTATGAAQSGAQTATGTTAGQTPAPAVALSGRAPLAPGEDASWSWRRETFGPNHIRLSGDVELKRGDISFFADEVDIFNDTHMMTATGNVVFVTPTHRIAADRVEFNLQTHLGTFYNASGTATLAELRRHNLFGSQEPDIYFYGETLEKLGEKKYRINSGGFTACVQPTPRWELTSGSVVLNLDNYALLTNTLLKVKGLPVLYLPVVYYPINKEDRATGFLIPTYGASSIRGQTISNAFFLALGRSHDATLTHDWFSRTGQAFGGEYRYVTSDTSRGDLRYYRIAERPTTTTNTEGKEQTVPGRRYYEFRGNASQTLPFNLRGRARLDYSSDLSIQQAYQQNIYDATRRQRYMGGNVSGSWGSYTLNASADRNEYFFSQTASAIGGSKPRVTLGYSERPIAGSILYGSVNSEYASIIRQSKSGTNVSDLGLQRFDITPALRLPFNRWPFLTVNSSVAWRYTRWDRSRSATGALQDEPTNRTYVDMQARIVGPVFNRIWNANNRFAEKIKHTIEPFVQLQRVSNFEVSPGIIQHDGTDTVVPGVTKYSYGLSNRVYAKQMTGESTQSVAREILNVVVAQSYYTDARASAVDAAYASSFQGRTPTKFSPVALQVRASPVIGLDAGFRAEYDVQWQGFRTMSFQGSWSYRDWLTSSGSWSNSKYFSAADPTGRERQAQSVSGQASFRFKQGRFGWDTAFNYDIKKQYFLQRRVVAYYNAQCCGFGVDYQVYDFGRLIFVPGYSSLVRADKRFNVSITLAGLGTFSNFLGALGIGGNSQTFR